jgi:hypothetical protein
LKFKKIIYNFNISNEEANEWDNLQQQYSKIHEINGWENINLDELILAITDSQKLLLINMKEIEPYDLIYEHAFQKQFKHCKNKHQYMIFIKKL